MTAKQDWLATRTSLLARLKDHQNAGGWEEFCDVYGKVIYAVALKSGMGRADIEDVVQETMVRIAKLIPSFEYDPAKGSFKSWVLTIARSRMIDCIRKRERERRFDAPVSGDSATSLLSRLPDEHLPNLDELFEAEWRQGLLEAATERVRQRISPAQYQLFDLHVRQEWEVGKIVATMGVTANQVYLAKHRVSEAIREEARRLELGR